jgi:uncharacterized protein
MSERTQYPPGVPCWVDTLQADPQKAAVFYAGLFGWEFIGPGPMPGLPQGEYFVAQLRGRDVAGVASRPPQAQTAWNTYVAVASADETCALVQAAGGAVLVAPVDAPPAGRLAVICDPAGATLGLWEAKERRGAQLVNEAGAWAMSTLLTRDLDASRAFYGKIFGWTTQPFAAGEVTIELCRLDGYTGGEPSQPVPRDVVGLMAPLDSAGSSGGVPAHWSVDFWIADTDRAASTAASLGATVVVPPHDALGFRRCVIADPQGAVFSLSKLTAR